MITEAVILAGGLGTRLRPVVNDVPKPLALVGGRPFLEYQLDYLIAQGIGRVVLSVGYLWHKIEQHFGDRYKSLNIAYAVEAEPLGTGGGLLQATALCQPDAGLLVLNGDTWFPVPLAELSAIQQQRQADVTIALRQANSAGRYAGIVLDNNNRIVNFLSSGDEGSGWINGGVYLISPQILVQWRSQSGKALSLEQDLLEAGIAASLNCYGYPADAAFIDIGVPEDYARAVSVIKSE